jgi:patatin-like phospholipase/acyl hydrolase
MKFILLPLCIIMTKFILSIAGGGIRGAAVVRLLRELEEFLKFHNGNTLYDQFDMYTGASTGALISAGIAYNGMTAGELGALYTYEMSNEIMNKNWIDYIFGLVQTRPKYDGVGKRRVIQNIATNTSMDQTDKDVLIPLYDVTQQIPVFAKSWDTDASSQSLTLVLDATTAAPCYFPSVEYKKDCWAIDGGVICNNPSMATYIEAKEMYPEEKIVLLSLGTGYGNDTSLTNLSSKWGSLEWMAKGDLIGILMDAPLAANLEYTSKLMKSQGDVFLHVDGFLPNTTTDDTTQENITTLEEFGETMWEKNKYEIKKIFGPKTVHIVADPVFL